MPWNAVMMPHTVPKRPMNGAELATVARNGRYRSMRATSDDPARRSARLDALSRSAGSPSSASSSTWSTISALPYAVTSSWPADT